jgi:hypothetical protein
VRRPHLEFDIQAWSLWTEQDKEGAGKGIVSDIKKRHVAKNSSAFSKHLGGFK